MSGLTKPGRSIVALISVVLIVPCAAGGWLLTRKCPCLISPQPPESALPVGWIYGSNQVVQSFHAAQDGLCGVSLWLGGRQRTEDVRTSVQAVGVTEEDPVVGQVDVRNWSTTTLCTFVFRPVSNSAGRDYALTLEAPDATRGRFVPLRVFPEDVMAGELRLNGLPTGGDMALAPCYRPQTLRGWSDHVCDRIWEHYATLDTLLNRLSQYKPFYYKRPQWIVLFILNTLGLSWLLVYLSAQALPRYPWTLRRSLYVGLVFDLVGFAVFLGLGVGSDRLGAENVVLSHKTKASAVEERSPSSARRIVYDFVFTLEGGAGVTIETPEEEYTSTDWLALGDDPRPVLFMHPPSKASYWLAIPEGDPRLEFALALDPSVWDKEGDGVTFTVIITTESGSTLAFEKEIDPKNRSADRRWHETIVDLGPYAGQSVGITLATYPGLDSYWDWAVWGQPVITVVPQHRKPRRAIVASGSLELD